MMPTKHILLLGAGKSATVVIDYLKRTVLEKQWLLTVADHDLVLVQQKLGPNHPAYRALALDICDDVSRKSLIATADVVISLMPPALHHLVALDCLELGIHLLTASYVDDRIRALEDQVRDKNILFLCEMGLDPGIDHMSAMQLIHQLKQDGASIQAFHSHCGGLVAPESDDNPWHYKISWNPRNVVLAGKAGAIFRENGMVREIPYEEVFRQANSVQVPGIGALSYYPNRNSLNYIDLYELTEIKDFVRTTLRHPDFCKGWQRIVELRLTDDQVQYDTTGLNLTQLLVLHFQHHGLSTNLDQMAQDALQQELFNFLQLNRPLPLNKGVCTMADVLQWLMESTWVLRAGDKDMIVMLHEIAYTDKHGKQKHLESCLVVVGEDEKRTAMARTVGLPLGLAAVLLLEDKIQVRGLHIPIIPAIYEPVLALLQEEGVIFTESRG